MRPPVAGVDGHYTPVYMPEGFEPVLMTVLAFELDPDDRCIWLDHPYQRRIEAVAHSLHARADSNVLGIQ